MAAKEPPANDKARGGGGGGTKDFFIGVLTGFLLAGMIGGYVAYRKKPAMRRAQDATAEALRNTGIALEAKLEAWNLTPADIENELTQSGKIVRQSARAVGTGIADAARDAKLTAVIKAKFALDKEVSAVSINVETTDARVTLSGNATTKAQISRAIMLALETEGVREVNSTLRVKH
jgi:osmotically-inducible protein OsmY